jgi:hypothetical protein
MKNQNKKGKKEGVVGILSRKNSSDENKVPNNRQKKKREKKRIIAKHKTAEK